MASRQESPLPPLTGRIDGGPSTLLRDVVLDPQLRYDVEHLLPRYVAIEKVLAVEYLRMGLIDRSEAREIGAALDSANPESVYDWSAASMHDLAFALERHVEHRLPAPIPRWHVDRSRNDLQACGQLLLCRARLIDIAGTLRGFGASAHRLAGRSTDIPMPGYTHFQAAHIITPGFYFAAVSGQVVHTLRRLLATYDGIDACPLGAGAMAGQELAWDRDRMARLLGFRQPQPLALTSVASRAWAVEVTAELELLGVALSRFCTDLLTWSGSRYGFIDLPDELSGISSAMPQKKNFPVLERIRGKTAHLMSCHVDAALGQRNTPYTNLVEVSKEASAQLLGAFETAEAILRLFTAVLDSLTFRSDRMARECAREYFGGFSLANTLTLNEGVPWRTAQVIVGAYISAAIEAGLAPGEGGSELLRGIAAGHGFELTDPAGAIAAAFDVDHALRRMASAGSTRPDAVRTVLTAQAAEYELLGEEWSRRAAATSDGLAATDRLLGLSPDPAGSDE